VSATEVRDAGPLSSLFGRDVVDILELAQVRDQVAGGETDHVL
jgi:hypothetical protein